MRNSKNPNSGTMSDRGLRLGADLGKGHSKADVDALQQGAVLFRLTGERAFLDADKFYATKFTTLNGSGVTGEAILAYDVETNRLIVAISASGLEPGQVHIQHIHGFPSGQDAVTPTMELDLDRDGFIELSEGGIAYGPILLDLSTNHDNGAGGDNGHSHGDLAGFPTAPEGIIWFIESYTLPQGLLGADPRLALREIVLHGLTVEEGVGTGSTGPDPNEVDGTGGYKLVLPVASGEIFEIETAKELRAFLADTDFDDDARANNSPGKASSGNEDFIQLLGLGSQPNSDPGGF